MVVNHPLILHYFEVICKHGVRSGRVLDGEHAVLPCSRKLRQFLNALFLTEPCGVPQLD